MPPKSAQREADELYGLPLEEFTPQRNALAQRLRKEGRREEADAVKALRKPTAAAWALNQLARRRPDDVKRLLAAGRNLRKAHQSLLKGGGRDAVQEATAQERALVDELARDASAVAGEAGTAASTSFDEHIRNTLHAAALDEDTAGELKAGRLLRERAAAAMFGGDVAGPAPKAPSRKGKPDDGARKRDLERAAAAARATEKTARRAHERSVKARERAAKALQDAEARAEKARAALRDAERDERQAAKALDHAVRDAETAEASLD
jgi:hypothetical protein